MVQEYKLGLFTNLNTAEEILFLFYILKNIYDSFSIKLCIESSICYWLLQPALYIKNIYEELTYSQA